MEKIDNYFHLGGSYKFFCPKCKVGLLKFDAEKFIKEETKISKKSEQNIYGEKEITEYIFNAILVCNNCEDIVSVNGYGDVVEYEVKTRIDAGPFEPKFDWLPVKVDRFYPLYFHPTIDLFQINSNCPKEILTLIRSSFNLFWCDKNASANKIRIVVEKILEKVDNKNHIKNLHQEIKNSNNLTEEVKKYLLAIKWIGNSGSHKTLNIKTDDMIDGYKLLEHSINLVFSNYEELEKISKEINQNKDVRKN
ncbi:DUF4145 domain-containing protein [Myroides odoratus]|uniref:DUF4145 domain-containing protein n=1 Tax=Myroides odoratus TaxID=256 RepID=UPI00333EA3FC